MQFRRQTFVEKGSSGFLKARTGGKEAQRNCSPGGLLFYPSLLPRVERANMKKSGSRERLDQQEYLTASVEYSETEAR